MFERMLISLDGSKLLERILPYAEVRASRFGSNVILLQVATVTRLALASAGAEAQARVGIGAPAYTNQMIAEQM